MGKGQESYPSQPQKDQQPSDPFAEHRKNLPKDFNSYPPEMQWWLVEHLDRQKWRQQQVEHEKKKKAIIQSVLQDGVKSVTEPKKKHADIFRRTIDERR